MNELVFATNNKYKIIEIEKMLGSEFRILSLSDIGCNDEVPETMPTIEGNASQKAFYIFNNFHYNCFADDTGLEIEALNNEPGVYSARYAGETKNSRNNIEKVLLKMQNVTNRKAQFKTVISLVINGEEKQFEGIVKGNILQAPVGNDGFGYDPIFQPFGYNISFAQMSLTDKNKISHRGIAFRKMTEYLTRHFK